MSPLDFTHRQQSFRTWPYRSPARADVLAEAGFYYLDKDYYIQCFSCGIILNWRHGCDDTWVVHARESPTCKYVETVKGSEFVQYVQQQLMPEERPVRNSASYEMVVAEENIRAAAHSREQSIYRSHEARPLQPRTITDMRIPAVRAVMEVCEISIEQIRSKLEQIRMTQGCDYQITTQDFVDLIK